MTTPSTDLIVLPAPGTALAVFTAENGTDPFLSQIRVQIDEFKASQPDVTTRKGRDAIASFAYRISRSKTALDNVGKELVAEQKKVPALIDAERKRMRDLMDSWRDEVRAPLDRWDAIEDERKRQHESAMLELNQLADAPADASAADLAQRIESLQNRSICEAWEEYEAEAARTKDKGLAKLRTAWEARKRYEAEQAELARLRVEAAERERIEREQRIAQEAADKARREEEERAQHERLAAERREAELKLQAERAERERLEAQQRAERAERQAAEQAEQAAAAERQRIADEQAAREKEDRRRAANREHKGNVMRAAKEAFMRAGITEDQAREVVKLIATGQVPNVTITY